MFIIKFKYKYLKAIGTEKFSFLADEDEFEQEEKPMDPNNVEEEDKQRDSNKPSDIKPLTFADVRTIYPFFKYIFLRCPLTFVLTGPATKVISKNNNL